MKRVCCKCKIEKPIDDFYKVRARDDYNYSCAACLRAKRKSTRIKSPDIIEGEIWKDVIGYEGFYQVSNIGRLKSLSRVKDSPFGSFTSQEQILATRLTKFGYIRAMLQRSGIRKMYNVHRIVAISFIPNPLNLPQVNHIDGNKSNNNVGNLEWVSVSENGTHAFLNKTTQSNNWGIMREKRYNTWTVVLLIAPKTKKYFGSFKSLEDAIVVRNEAMIKYGLVNKYA